MPAKKVKSKKKAAPKKKAAVKKRAAPKKKAAVKKKAAPKKKAAVKKKAAPKKKAVPKKKAAKKEPAEKKPTKAELAEQKAQAKREEKKKKRIELLNKRSPVELPIEGITPYTMHRGESYMSDSQLEHFRNILLTWKQELLDEVKRTVEQMKQDANQHADPADRATQEEEFSLELRTRDRESKLVRKINKTLAAIDAEDYGYCESCGIEIGIKRLEARPTATLCIDCKTLQEIKEKQIYT